MFHLTIFRSITAMLFGTGTGRRVMNCRYGEAADLGVVERLPERSAVAGERE
jgi:hypothetical protein